MPKPYNLDALEGESSKEPFRFIFDGEEYELPPSPDFRAVSDMASGRLDVALERMLGTEQWQRLQDSPAVFDAVRFNALFDRYFKYAGTDMGEASASTDSSASTGRPSKRTSSGTTKSR